MLSVHARCRLSTAAARAFHLHASVNVADSSLNEALPFAGATGFTELGSSCRRLWGIPFIRSFSASGREAAKWATSGLESKSRACVVTARGLVVEKKKCVTGSAR